MLIVNLNNIGITVDVVLGVGWALVLGMSGTLLGIKIRDYINENKEENNKNERR